MAFFIQKNVIAISRIWSTGFRFHESYQKLLSSFSIILMQFLLTENGNLTKNIVQSAE